MTVPLSMAVLVSYLTCVFAWQAAQHCPGEVTLGAVNICASAASRSSGNMTFPLAFVPSELGIQHLLVRTHSRSNTVAGACVYQRENIGAECGNVPPYLRTD